MSEILGSRTKLYKVPKNRKYFYSRIILQNRTLVEHRQAFIHELWTSSGLRTTIGAATYIIAMDYAAYGMATLRLGVLKRTLSQM